MLRDEAMFHRTVSATELRVIGGAIRIACSPYGWVGWEKIDGLPTVARADARAKAWDSGEAVAWA